LAIPKSFEKNQRRQTRSSTDLWESPDSTPTGYALVAELSDQGFDYRQVIAKVELVPKKPRGAARRGHFGGDRQNSLNLE
jgi:hypothetical protein